MRKLGIILILVGFFIPLILFFFSSYYNPYYNPKHGLLESIMWESKLGTKNPLWELRVWTVLYKHILIGGITLIFLGTGIIALSKK